MEILVLMLLYMCVCVYIYVCILLKYNSRHLYWCTYAHFLPVSGLNLTYNERFPTIPLCQGLNILNM